MSNERITIHKAELTKDQIHKLHILLDAAPADITPSEKTTLLWLSSCDKSIVDNIISLLHKSATTGQDPIDGVLSISDAAALWELDTSTIRRAIKDGRLAQDLDCYKLGKQWTVTKAAMTRLYGTPAKEDPT